MANNLDIYSQVASMIRGKKQKKGNYTEEVPQQKGAISQFLEDNYKHFNAGTLLRAAQAYKDLIDRGGKMMITLAGAMSTGELGITLAEMIRQNKVQAITCTGANLEEDVFNLVAHDSYVPLPNYRHLPLETEEDLADEGFSRVTDTAIKNDSMKLVEDYLTKMWKDAKRNNQSFFPHEYFFKLLLSGKLEKYYQIDPKNSWMLAAAQADLCMVVPGWEDSSLGNIFASEVYDGELPSSVIKGGIDYMVYLIDEYKRLSKDEGIGFFQIGGGISGDMPICVVPLLKLDLKQDDTPFWKYFCQISDAVTSYGGYSGATPDEKITWYKIDKDTPQFVIESDASIVAPLIFAYILNM